LTEHQSIIIQAISRERFKGISDPRACYCALNKKGCELTGLCSDGINEEASAAVAADAES
jgi:hypothetical protein